MRTATVLLVLLLAAPFAGALALPGRAPTQTVLGSMGEEIRDIPRHSGTAIYRVQVASGAETPAAEYVRESVGGSSNSGLHASDHNATYYFVRAISADQVELVGIHIGTLTFALRNVMPALPYGAGGLEYDPPSGAFFYATHEGVYRLVPGSAPTLFATPEGGGFDPREADYDGARRVYYIKLYPFEFGAPPRLVGYRVADGSLVADVPVPRDFYGLQADPGTGSLYSFHGNIYPFYTTTLIQIDPDAESVRHVVDVGGTVQVGEVALDWKERVMVVARTQLAPAGGYTSHLEAYDLATGSLVTRGATPTTVGYEFLQAPLPR